MIPICSVRYTSVILFCIVYLYSVENVHLVAPDILALFLSFLIHFKIAPASKPPGLLLALVSVLLNSVETPPLPELPITHLHLLTWRTWLGHLFPVRSVYFYSCGQSQHHGRNELLWG